MARLGVLVLVFLCIGCSSRKDGDALVGTYVFWTFIDGRPVGNSLGTNHTLTLEPGGTYVLQIESTVMTLVTVRAEGTYERTGDDVRLRGQQTVSSDDGYQKATHSGPHKLDLVVADGMLVSSDSLGDPVYYRKEGTGPPPLPEQLQLKPSDQDALDALTQVEEAYSSLESLRVTGSVKSQGGGFVAKDAKFSVLYKRPSTLRFESSIYEGDTEIDRVEITWDGGATCWWYSKEYGETRDRPVGNALSIAAVTFGPQLDILPALLLAQEANYDGLSDQYPEAKVLSDETIDGTPCTVLQLRSQGAQATKLWIDKSNGMILKLYEELRDVTVTFDPQPNVAIRSMEFQLGNRSRSRSTP